MALALLAASPFASAIPAIAQGEAPSLEQQWGILAAMVDSQWTTRNETRPRISTYHWEQGQAGLVLIARHGFESSLSLGERWFDIQQRMELDPATGTIRSRYTYSDGRPPLGQAVLYRGGWQRPATTPEPSGGTTVDTEARAAISALIAALADAGVFPAS